MTRNPDQAPRSRLWAQIDPDGVLAAAAHGDVALALEVLDELLSARHLLNGAGSVVRQNERGRWCRALDVEDVVLGLIRAGFATSQQADASAVGDQMRWAHPIVLTHALAPRWSAGTSCGTHSGAGSATETTNRNDHHKDGGIYGISSDSPGVR